VQTRETDSQLTGAASLASGNFSHTTLIDSTTKRNQP